MKNNHRLKTLAASAGVLGSFAAGNTADADVIAPPGLNPGDKFHMVFLSATTTTASSSDPTGYDALVTNDAAAAGVNSYAGNSVTWQTLGSFTGGPTAVDRFNPSSGVYTLDGDLIANNGADLYDNSIYNPVNVRPNLSVADIEVWTGSNASGGAAKETIGGATPQFGLSGAIDQGWLASANGGSNSETRPIYSFSNELTVVPEPTTWLGALVAAVTGLFARFRRKR